jgi:hypothetical protein
MFMHETEIDDEKIDIDKAKKRSVMVSEILGIIIFLPIIFIVLSNLLEIENIIGKIFMIGVLVILLSFIITMIFQKMEHEHLSKIFQKVPTAVFLVLWFGLTLTLTLVFLINKEYEGLLVPSIFLVFGLIIIYKDFLKKK